MRPDLVQVGIYVFAGACGLAMSAVALVRVARHRVADPAIDGLIAKSKPNPRSQKNRRYRTPDDRFRVHGTACRCQACKEPPTPFPTRSRTDGAAA